MSHPATDVRKVESLSRAQMQLDLNAPEASQPISDLAEVMRRRYEQARRHSEALCRPLAIEDYVIQTMPEVSPTKWHLAHTSWFFETLVLKEAVPGYQPLDPAYAYLFNSYYNTFGEQYCRPKRGLLSRPTVDDIFAYRRHIDEQMQRFFETADETTIAGMLPIIEIGINHEQQHQELMLTDIKHVFAANELRTTYGGWTREIDAPPPIRWIEHEEGIVEIGHDGHGFAYDNEGPRHRTFVESFAIASRLITCGEYMQFMQDGGYERPELWLSDGWATINEEGWTAPLYWERVDGEWHIFTLGGRRPINPHEPVCHVSFYEADAYARWANKRLPREAEWEAVAVRSPVAGNLVETGAFHPLPLDRDADGERAAQMIGDVWEWTRSPYEPYPGYRPPTGALGEYNSKFMCSQMVLRGGSCATAASHIRRTYRNFFSPEARWQFTGIRLASDA